MKKQVDSGRRHFLRRAAVGGVLLSGVQVPNLQAKPGSREYLHAGSDVRRSADRVRLGLIGCGIQGFSNAGSAVDVSGVEITAACDLYRGRLERVREIYGNHIYITSDYRELLAREDVDAVCVSTPDHWHDHITIAALEAGKPVYCEKPMVQHLREGSAVISAQDRSGLVVQVGSQGVSSIATDKARELLEQGVIGELILVDIRNDRNSANGAWQYSIPTDASPETVDWDRFLGDAPKRPFDKTRFFRWRNYHDYGTGIAGDLFVHQFSTLHAVTRSLGPERIYATGGLRFWKDGREVPDVTLGLYDYPETDTHPAFNVQMRVNFVDGGGGGSHVRLIGTEGVMTLGWTGIQVQRSLVNTVPGYGGWDSYGTFSEKQQADYRKWYESHYPSPKPEMTEPGEMEYLLPEGYSQHVDHWSHFIHAVRTKGSVVEDSRFGMRAAGPALASNVSLQEKRIVVWDPEKMTETDK